MPPLDRMAALAMPPNDTTSKPPLDTVVRLATPPLKIATVPEARTTRPLLVWPDVMLTTWPLLTLVAVIKPSAPISVMSGEVRELIAPLTLALLKASLPALLSQSPRSPLLGSVFQPSSDVPPLLIEK